MHYREFIRTTIENKLLNNTLAGTNVFVMRAYPVSKSNVPAIIIYTNEETSEPNTIGTPGTSLRELTLSVEIYVKKQVNPDSEIDTIAEQVETILGANNDLDGDVKLIEYEGVEIESNGEGDNLFFVATMEFSIIYRVVKNDPTNNV